MIQDTTERKLADLELERVHKQLMTASRQAGMAEVATNVLHNVGNILNSVNISVSLVSERVKQSKAPEPVPRGRVCCRSRATAWANSSRPTSAASAYRSTFGNPGSTARRRPEDDPAGAGLAARATWNTSRTRWRCSRATPSSAASPRPSRSSIWSKIALRLNAGAFTRHGVTLRREFSDVPPITVDKHKVVQILVNLVRNAKYACDESGRRTSS